MIARLRAQIDVQAAVGGEESGADAHLAFIEADQTFHRLMYEAAGVSELYDLVRRRSGHVDRLRRLHLYSAGKMRAILRDHRRIVEAIAAGDPAAAQAAVREHLSGTLAKVDEIRRSHPDYLTD